LPLTVTQPDSSGGRVISSGSITGIIIGAVALLVLVGLIIVLLQRRSSAEEEEGIDRDDGFSSAGYTSEHEFECSATEFLAADLTLDNPMADDHGLFGAFADIFNIADDEAVLAF
jgi:hypothetical protein